MGLTIDEAIKKAREVAETNMYKAKTYDDDFLKRFHTNTDKCKQCAEEHEQLADWLEKLKAYEQAEEDGLLIKLPCRVGDVVYYFSNVGNVKHVEELKIYRLSSLVLLMEDEVFGKTVFLTKAEAEQALAKMKGE